ncbi:MAG: ATP-binding cassette domain-containing protein [Firmicutes bacterium]|nr:ATP-binding cassette domain-containing protein [Bacillota bacterium]
MPSSDRTVIRMRNVCFSYSSQSRRVLSDINLSVEKGEHVVVLGASGSGKSTLLRLIVGLLSPDSGSIEVRTGVGLVLQDASSQIIGATVEEDVAFGPQNLGLTTDEVTRRVSWALRSVKAEHLRHRRPQTLSRGELQRIAIAGVLAMSPRILLLDEATAFLDADDGAWLRELITQANTQGVTVIEATHSLHAAGSADRVLVLQEGRLLRTGRPSDVLPDHSALVQAGIRCGHDQQAVFRKAANSLRPAILRLQPPTVPATCVVRSGECLAVIGRSGSGKTAWALSLLGLNPGGWSLKKSSTLSADKRLAVVFQEPEQYLWAATAEEELGIDKKDPSAVVSLLEELRLPSEYLTRRPHDLSAGEQRRLALGAALARRPDILLADEPTAGLDAPTHWQVLFLLNRWLARGGCLILVTRVKEHLQLLADHCVIVEDGQAVFCGPVSEDLKASPWLIEAGL